MQIIDKTYEGCAPLYPLDRICDTNKALFIDIETTGLKKETTDLYLIGCGYYVKEGFVTKLFFADDPSEEKELLSVFYDFLKSFSYLIHFNGTKFDIPYLSYKADKYEMNDYFKGMEQIDLYKLCAPLRYLLFPQSMRQKCIEDFLGIDREDMYNGGELIEVYKDYVSNRRTEDLRLLITHNREDVLGMHLITPILYYLDLKDATLYYRGYTINDYEDYNGNKCREAVFMYDTDASFPVSFAAKTETMYVKASAKDKYIHIRLPIYHDDMKIFFENYRDYRYIPDEDRVIPVSLAACLPKDRYRKATKDNCYVRYEGDFIKQPSDIFTPVFKTAYKDKKKYFRFPESFDEKAAETFGRELINIFFRMKRRPSAL